jgi:hypothetical protein
MSDPTAQLEALLGNFSNIASAKTIDIPVGPVYEADVVMIIKNRIYALLDNDTISSEQLPLLIALLGTVKIEI